MLQTPMLNANVSMHLHSLVTLSELAKKGMNLNHILNGLLDTKAEVINLTQDMGKGEGKDEDVVEDDKDEGVEMEDVPQSHHGALTGTVTTSKTNCPVSRNCKGKIYKIP